MKSKKDKSHKLPVFKVFTGLITLVCLIIIALILLGNFGFGFGNGSGNGNNTVISKNHNASISENSAVEDEKTTQPETETPIIEITVSGREYLYQNNKIELDDFIEELNQFDKNIEIRISSDETATVNAMDNLTEKLNENGYTGYIKINN